MSAFNFGFVLPPLQTIAIVPAYRAIANIIATVTIEETHRDELIITEHPVEYGAPISDHSYKRPAEVTIRAGWTNSGFTAQNVISIYNQLLILQAQRTPFTLYTGKRIYQNMLLASLVTVTNQQTENALFITAICRQIIIVTTQSVAVSTDPSVQSHPAQTAPAVPNGDVNLQTTTPFFQGPASNPPTAPAL